MAGAVKYESFLFFVVCVPKGSLCLVTALNVPKGVPLFSFQFQIVVEVSKEVLVLFSSSPGPLFQLESSIVN
jgi:hypothetical protein